MRFQKQHKMLWGSTSILYVSGFFLFLEWMYPIERISGKGSLTLFIMYTMYCFGISFLRMHIDQRAEIRRGGRPESSGYQLEQENINQMEKISTEGWGYQPGSEDIDRRSEISTGEGKYRPQRDGYRPERGSIYRRIKTSTEAEKQPVRSTHQSRSERSGYQLEQENINQMEKISTEGWGYQPGSEDIDRRSEISTGEGKYRPQRDGYRPERGSIYRRIKTSTEAEKQPVRSTHQS